MTFRQQQKDHLVFVANRLAIAGLAFLALAMTGAVILITDYLFGTGATVITGIAAALTYLMLWLALPLRRRVKGEAEGDEADSRDSSDRAAGAVRH